MKLELDLTDEQVTLLMKSERMYGDTVHERLRFMIEEACFLSQMDAGDEARNDLYRLYKKTPPGTLDDGEEIPF